MDFSEALMYVKDGKKVQRSGWNGKNMWIRYFDPSLDHESDIVVGGPYSEGLLWLPFIIMKTVDNKLVPWLASQTDILAVDWQVVSE